MSAAAAAPLLGVRPIRVAIMTADPTRRAALAATLAGHGYVLAASVDDADIVLAAGQRAVAEAPVVALGGNPDAAGQLAEDASAAQIDAAIRAVTAGLRVRGADVASPGFRPMNDEGAPLLTPRELDVLIAIGQGLSNKEIARKLGISPHTVKFHLESLFRKLGATNRAEAVAKGGQAVHL